MKVLLKLGLLVVCCMSALWSQGSQSAMIIGELSEFKLSNVEIRRETIGLGFVVEDSASSLQYKTFIGGNRHTLSNVSTSIFNNSSELGVYAEVEASFVWKILSIGSGIRYSAINNIIYDSGSGLSQMRKSDSYDLYSFPVFFRVNASMSKFILGVELKKELYYGELESNFKLLETKLNLGKENTTFRDESSMIYRISAGFQLTSKLSINAMYSFGSNQMSTNGLVYITFSMNTLQEF